MGKKLKMNRPEISYIIIIIIIIIIIFSTKSQYED